MLHILVKRIFKSLFLVLFLISSCMASAINAVTKSDNKNLLVSDLCTKNAFLKRYHCSLEKVEEASEKNNADAQYALGYMYYYGVGTVQDKQTGELWIRRAAAQGQLIAQQALGILLQHEYPKKGSFKMMNTGAQPKRSNAKPIKLSQLNHDSAQVKRTTAHSYVQGQRNKPLSRSSTNKKVADNNDRKRSAELANLQVTDSRTTSRQQPKASKYDIAKAIGHHYTLQLFGSYHMHAVNHFMLSSGLKKGLSFYKTRFNARDWYVVIYGDYKSITDAKFGLRQLPGFVKKQHPWIKSYYSVQKDMKKQAAV